MKTLKNLVLSVILVSVITSCGNKEDKKKESFTYENKTTSKETTEENSMNVVIITANDAMQFDTKEIKVEAGKKVKLTLKHIGKLNKQAMGHNFVLLNQGVDLVAFANKAAAAGDNEYIPADATKDIIIHTILLGGGETAVIEFDAPEVGTYDFLCSFPGHYAMMKGKFIVE